MKHKWLKVLVLVPSLVFGATTFTSCTSLTETANDVGLMIQGNKTLKVGESVQLSCFMTGDDQGIAWASTNTEVATVSDNGLVTALKEGETEIIANSVRVPDATDTVKIKVLSNLAQIHRATFLNYDGSLLYETDVNEGEVVVYEGDTPLKRSSDKMDYTFSGWDNDPEAGIKVDTTFVAQFKETPINFDLFSFYLTTRNTYTVKYHGTEKNVVLPRFYNFRKVDGVAAQGFVNNQYVESVTMNENYVYIGQYAFQNCKNLKYFDAPSLRVIDAYGFAYCDGLEEVELPESCVYIGAYAFVNCKNLTNITISDECTVIGQSAFQNDEKLLLNKVPAKVETIGDDAFSGCKGFTGKVVLPDTLTALGKTAFGYTSITSINIPKSVTTLGDSPFIGMFELEEINVSEENTLVKSVVGIMYNKEGDTLLQAPAKWKGGKEALVVPEGVKTIESFAFTFSYITAVTLPASLETIESNSFYISYGIKKIDFAPNSGNVALGLSAFATCKGLEVLDLSNTKIDELARQLCDSCENLTTFIAPDSLTTLGINAFNGTKLSKFNFPKYLREIPDGCFEGTLLEEVIMPDTVEIIGSSAFEDCPKLKKVRLSPNIKSLAGRVFAYCEALTDINLEDFPKSLELSSDGYVELPYGTFRDTPLKSFTVPDGYTKLGNYSFMDCWLLEEVTIPSSMKVIGKWVFSNSKLKTIKFKGSEEEFKKIKLDSADDDDKETSNVYLWKNATVIYNYKEGSAK